LITVRAQEAGINIRTVEQEQMGDLLLALRSPEPSSRPDTGEGVHVGTMHGAKGREWDVVFLPAFEKDIIPCASVDTEEERRLAFVALTRARHEVHISYCLNRPRAWGVGKSEPSQFIGEMETKGKHETENIGSNNGSGLAVAN